jgi:MFS family permease
MLGRQIAGSIAAILAAAGLATSPVALIEAMQTMNDVPVMAAWLACWLLLGFEGSGVRAGFAAGIAVLIRPNLAPLALIPALYAWRNSGWRHAVAFSIPVAIAGALVAYVQWRWFGSPLRSGYGTAQEIYSLANVAPNAVLYTKWLLEAHGPWLLLAPLAFRFTPIVHGKVTLRWMLAFAGLLVLSYFLYAVFEVWTYLRFLLPALAVAMIAVAAVVSHVIARLPRPLAPVTLVAIVLAIGGSQIAAARELGVFRTATQHARATLSGRYLASAMPRGAVLISGEQSGAGRYHSNRPVLRWDLLSPDALAPAIEALGRAGFEPWILLDTWEEELFRRRFATSALEIGALDWPPMVEAGRQLRTRGWRVADRARFMRGERVITDRLW